MQHVCDRVTLRDKPFGVGKGQYKPQKVSFEHSTFTTHPLPGDLWLPVISII
jgi:hypothetical protein